MCPRRMANRDSAADMVAVAMVATAMAAVLMDVLVGLVMFHRTLFIF